MARRRDLFSGNGTEPFDLEAYQESRRQGALDARKVRVLEQEVAGNLRLQLAKTLEQEQANEERARMMIAQRFGPTAARKFGGLARRYFYSGRV